MNDTKTTGKCFAELHEGTDNGLGIGAASHIVEIAHSNGNIADIFPTLRRTSTMSPF